MIREADKKEPLRVSQNERVSGFEDESGIAIYYFVMWDKDRIVPLRWVKNFWFQISHLGVAIHLIFLQTIC